MKGGCHLALTNYPDLPACRSAHFGSQNELRPPVIVAMQLQHSECKIDIKNPKITPTMHAILLLLGSFSPHGSHGEFSVWHRHRINARCPFRVVCHTRCFIVKYLDTSIPGHVPVPPRSLESLTAPLRQLQIGIDRILWIGNVRPVGQPRRVHPRSC